MPRKTVMTEEWTDPLDAIERGESLPFEQFVTFQINQLSTAFERQWTRFMREKAGVSLSEWRLLATLDGHGPLPFARIVDALGIDKALCSRSAQSLLSQGLLNSEPTPGDARSLTLSLTRKGIRLVSQVRPHALRRQRLLLSALAPQERQALYSAIHKLKAAAQAWERDPG